MKEKFLPIGTVILMKDATKRLMITGYCSSTPDNPEKVYDYVACLFPEGNLAGDEVALFNHDQIGNILHMGLDDQEFEQVNHQLLVAMYGENAVSEKNNSANMSGIDEGMMSPTPFDSEVIQRPKVDMSVTNLGDNSVSSPNTQNKAEDEKIISDLFPTVSIEEDTTSDKLGLPSSGEGSPVLQLQPIYGDGMVDMSTSSLTNDLSMSNTNVDAVLPFTLPVIDNSSM